MRTDTCSLVLCLAPTAGVGAPVATTPSSTQPETSVAQFSPGATTPLTTTSPSLSGDAASNEASIASHSSQGINSGDPVITTTGDITGISTGISGGYNTPAQTATTADPAAGTQGGNSGVLQNEAVRLTNVGMSVMVVVGCVMMGALLV